MSRETPAEQRSPGELGQLTIEADFRLLGEARALIHRTAIEVGFDEAAIWDIKVAATEALANAIEHGTSRNGLIHIRLSHEDGELSLEVSGGGRSEPAPARHDHQRGRGIFIMQALMDDVAVARDGDARSVRLAKRLTTASGDISN